MKESKSIYFNLYFSSNKHNVAQDLTLVIGQVLSFLTLATYFKKLHVSLPL